MAYTVSQAAQMAGTGEMKRDKFRYQYLFSWDGILTHLGVNDLHFQRKV